MQPADPVRSRMIIVTHYWLPHLGGIEVLARDQATRLVHRGWDVSVFTSQLDTDAPVGMDESVQVKRFRCTNILESRFNVPVPLMAPAMLRALLSSAAKTDVIVAHGHVYVGSLYAAITAHLKSVPLVVVQHNPFVDYPRVALNALESIADRSIGRAVLERASKVVAVSDFTKAFVERIAPKADVTRIYPGVDTERFFPGQKESGSRRPLFVTVRRLVPRNGVDLLIRAWVSGQLGRHADLAVVGEGPLRDRLIDTAQNDSSIRFLGRLADHALPDFYRNSDVFVLPTVSGEGYGLALAEALASGLPAIVSDDGGPRELVQDGVSGLLVRAGDLAALEAALTKMASDTQLRTRLAEGANSAGARLDRERSIIQLDALLRRVAAGSYDSATPGLRP